MKSDTAIVRHCVGALAATVAALLPALQARAQLVDIAWSAAGEFERSLTVAPDKFAELCGALNPGQSVQWRFEASKSLDFNLHFHVGKDVRYPARADQARELQGTLVVDSAQDYCWMWSNRSDAAASLQVHLRKR